MIEERDNNLKINYPHMETVKTRWSDNDIYGHVNNVIYYSYFDTVINNYLIKHAGFDIEKSAVIGIVVETKCRFNQPASYPEDIEVGLKISKIGNSSVRYELAVFRAGQDEEVACGYFVHVFVDRVSRKPVSVPDEIHSALLPLLGMQ